MDTNEKSTEQVSFGTLLISLYKNASEQKEAEKSLNELSQLVKTSFGEDADKNNIYIMTQCRTSPDVATYIGSGKAKEAHELCAANSISLVVIDGEMSPSQIRNLENEISGEKSELDVRVIDRTMLILDIFAKHAVTGEGKLQVEIAQLKYTSPRLTGKGTQLSRQGGTSSSGSVGARGPGETKLETDRRHIKRRIASLEEELSELESERNVKRSKRSRSGIPTAAIVGYTNAGKSTLLNYLTDAGILAEDKLFATLDPTVRKLNLPSNQEILLTDTVGFINNLPHGLIEAFKSTLDEARFADLLLIIIDASEEDAERKTEVTERTLNDLSAGGKPTIYVFNKCDKLETRPNMENLKDKKAVCISAKTGEGIDTLLSLIEKTINEALTKAEFLFPFDVQAPLNNLYKNANVLNVEYADSGSRVSAMVDRKLLGMYKEYLV